MVVSPRVTEALQQYYLNESKKKGKDQESIQSSATPDQGYQWDSDNFTLTSQTIVKRSAFSLQVTTRHQLTDAHESITKTRQK